MVNEILSSVLGIGLIFLILNNALKNLRYKIIGIINLCVGLSLSIIFIAALLIDYSIGSILKNYEYILFFGTTLIYSLGFSIYYLTYGRGNPFSNKNKKLIITSKYYYKEYLYIIYKYKTDIYLTENKKKFYGYVIKLSKNDFHDEIIQKLNKDSLITASEIKRLGKVTIRDKKKLYHCYAIDLFDNIDIKGFVRVNGYQVLNYPLDDFDKQIIYRLMLREPFDLEI